LVLVPLVRAIASGELPIEMNARGARYAEEGSQKALAANRELLERSQSTEEKLRDLEARSERNLRQAVRSATDLRGDVDDLDARLAEIEGRAR
jgi:hypothetical protein